VKLRSIIEEAAAGAQGQMLAPSILLLAILAQLEEETDGMEQLAGPARESVEATDLAITAWLDECEDTSARRATLKDAIATLFSLIPAAALESTNSRDLRTLTSNVALVYEKAGNPKREYEALAAHLYDMPSEVGEIEVEESSVAHLRVELA
jgi:hypothetical protein